MDNETQAVPSAPPEVPGYRLLEEISEGGMGVVYRASQLDSSRQVAIKFLNPFPESKAAAPARDFLRESHLMATLSHPNVVAIYGSGEIKGLFYLVMEYVAGGALRSLLKAGQPWPAVRAAPVLDAIAKGLTYIHGRDILHLDLKPDNVLCDQQGAVKITDFGLALSRIDAWTLSDLGLAQGTLDYCSPEQRYGLPIDQRSDLFSLATLAYELLTGQLPGRVYVPASRRNPQLPPAVDEVLRLGLERDPDDRYPVVELFRRDLMNALGKIPP